jgi:UDP:flavonoid glycosyltransferase YjiC (YdhE family)
MWAVFKGPVNRWRKRNGLPYLDMKTGIFGYIRKNAYPWFFGFSSHILPRPDDWDDNINVPGYWYLNEPEKWAPPSDLEDFINAGQPPLYFGFGSMIYRDSEKITSILIEALKMTGQRAVLSSGWSCLGNVNMPEYVHRIDSVPHSWLFPKMSAVIHHGGSGTTAASLRAGVPALIVPFLGDQFFWGNCVYQLGAGPKPLYKQRLTAENLAERINIMISDDSMRKKTVEIRNKLIMEDGVGKTVEIIRNYFDKINDNS